MNTNDLELDEYYEVENKKAWEQVQCWFYATVIIIAIMALVGLICLFSLTPNP